MTALTNFLGGIDGFMGRDDETWQQSALFGFGIMT